jgi:hypothetical protein
MTTAWSLPALPVKDPKSSLFAAWSGTFCDRKAARARDGESSGRA